MDDAASDSDDDVSDPVDVLANDDSADDAERVAATLVSPRGAALFGTTRRAMRLGQRLFRVAALVGVATCLYIVGLKLPAVLVAPSSGTVLSRGVDPVLGVLVIVFGGLWCAVGVCHLWSAWAFTRLRGMQTVDDPPTRPRRQVLRGGVVAVTGATVLALGTAYTGLLFG